MLVLFDHGTPKGLARALSGHTVHTAQSKGWHTLSNGALLNAAEAAGFELLLTTDRRTRAGMRAALELGRWTFPAPIGYLNAPKWSGKSLVADPERAPLIARAFEELATGRFTKQEVIARMTEAGNGATFQVLGAVWEC